MLPMVDAQLLKKFKEEIADLKRDKGQLKDENDRLWKVIRTLNELECTPHALSTSEDLLQMVMGILSTALEAVDSGNGSILLLDAETEELVFVAVVGEREKELTDYRIPADSGVAGWVNRHKKPALVPDVRKDDRWISAVDQSIGFHTQSLMAVPLLMGNRMLGVMEVVNSRSEDYFTEADLSLLQLVARLASFVFGCTEDALNQAPNPVARKNLN
jgi:sigma-B regulation protein RsbU (phosphoserine phosphatase)